MEIALDSAIPTYSGGLGVLAGDTLRADIGRNPVWRVTFVGERLVLVGALEAMRASLVKEVDRFKDRVVRAEKRQHDAVRDQVEKARVNLYPGGKLQERTLSPLYFLNKYSPAFAADLKARLSLDTTAHQVLTL